MNPLYKKWYWHLMHSVVIGCVFAIIGLGMYAIAQNDIRSISHQLDLRERSNQRLVKAQKGFDEMWTRLEQLKNSKSQYDTK